MGKKFKCLKLSKKGLKVSKSAINSNNVSKHFWRENSNSQNILVINSNNVSKHFWRENSNAQKNLTKNSNNVSKHFRRENLQNILKN